MEANETGEISRHFFVREDERLVACHVTISHPVSEYEEHFCRVRMSPFLLDEKRIFGADNAQAAELARKFVALLLDGRVVQLTKSGPPVSAEAILVAAD